MKMLMLMFSFFMMSHSSWAQLPQNTKNTYSAIIGTRTKAAIWLVEKDSIVTGEMQYEKGKSPIVLRGIQSGNECRILEFDKTGNITGIITGRLKGKSFTGEWFSPQTRKSFPMNLSLKQSAVLPKSSVKKIKIEGTYTYGYGKDGPQGYLEVKQASEDSAIIEINNVTAAPAYNQATIDPIKVPFNRNQIICSVQEKCTIRIRFYQDFAVIDYVDEQNDCLFGMNASVDGIYWKGK
jgi:hypothetical protein